MASAKKTTTHPSARIQRSGFIADIMVSHSSRGDIYHYIILRAGSPIIVHGGQEVSLQRATECVEDFLKQQELRKVGTA